MFAIVDPQWYEKYWLSEQPVPKRRPFSQQLARFGVVVALLAGGGVALSHFQPKHAMSDYPGWQQE